MTNLNQSVQPRDHPAMAMVQIAARCHDALPKNPRSAGRYLQVQRHHSTEMSRAKKESAQTGGVRRHSMRGRSHGEGIEWPLPRLFMQRYRISTRVEGTPFGTLCCRTARELNCERVVSYCSSDCNDWSFSVRLFLSCLATLRGGHCAGEWSP